MKTTEKFKAFIPVRSSKTDEIYLSEVELFQVPMDDIKRANWVSNTVMGFKSIYGVTADGKVLHFIKAGRWAKRDFKMMKELGVVELGCSWAFAPSDFEVDGRPVKIAETFEIGRETKEHFDRWLKALMG